MFAKSFLRTVLCALLIQACSPAPIPTTESNPTAPTEPTLVASVEAATAPMPTATVLPTAGPTATVWPPTFDPGSLEDIRELDSFVLTVNEKNTVNGQLTE